MACSIAKLIFLSILDLNDFLAIIGLSVSMSLPSSCSPITCWTNFNNESISGDDCFNIDKAFSLYK